jgi:hypothetical protein
MDEVFSTIGRLYLDLLQSQKIIDSLRKKLEDQEKEISSLQSTIVSQQN